MSTIQRTVKVELTSNDLRYILHSLSEFKRQCQEKINTDENGDDDLTHMYANDVMETKIVHDKIENIAVSVFGGNALKFSYELL